MCDERERLIGFLYDEVGASERRHVEAHLSECPECRAEMAGLRSTREDLLAWDVPAHEPVWRPMLPERPVPTLWQQIPAWAMAAAASMVLASGLVGALTVRWFSPPAQIAGVSNAGTFAAPDTMRIAVPDVAEIESRVLARLREELRREPAASAEPIGGPRSAPSASADGRDMALMALTRRLGELERWKAAQDEWTLQQTNLNYAFENRLSRANSRTRALDNELEAARMNLLRVGTTGGADFVR